MKSFSQAGQDIFPQALLRNVESNKTYLDIGCHHPTTLNNSYALELAGWTGLSIDIQNFHQEFKTSRTNTFKQADVTTVDWSPIVETYFPTRKIDYISFDVDDATSAAFQHFPFSTVRFKTMTIEHDGYRVGTQLRDSLRSSLAGQGYTLVCGDVICEGYGAFEDWWADMSEVDTELAKLIRCNNTASKTIKNILLQY